MEAHQDENNTTSMAQTIELSAGVGTRSRYGSGYGSATRPYGQGIPKLRLSVAGIVSESFNDQDGKHNGILESTDNVIDVVDGFLILLVVLVVVVVVVKHLICAN